ncbi:MAG TPA: GvpL/GvpF family gas vesicle protein [Streptosporangiaceae bacterium]|jgi:hypothetical protein|nr:GvpL/GvpF family gas vesicle protein [Streptosporangiaceae bacterium]
MVQMLMIRNGGAGEARIPKRSTKEQPAEDEVVWVYAITDRLDEDQITGLTGVGGEPVRGITEAGLTAVVGSVAARDFGEDALTSLLTGLASIERVGRAHHQVIACVAAAGPVLPLRLAALYSDDATVRALLAQRRGEFAEMLATFRNTEEWGLKIYVEPGAEASADDEETAHAWEEVDACADMIDRTLNGIAITGRRNPSPDPQFSGSGSWMVLNGSYLLASDRVAEFAAVAQALARTQTGVHADLTGPWPPYSFVDQLEA